MTIWQTLKIVWTNIIKNRMRSFLTMLGMIIGVASVILLVSLMQGFYTSMLDSYADMGINNVSVTINGRNGNMMLTEDDMYKYAYEFSGGQRQRICIARALCVNPEMVVCDEPVSALDVSIQAQVLNLMKDLQKELGLTYVFIAHDLSVVEYMSDRIAVMYLGKVVELATSKEMYYNHQHPYTEALLSAVPIPEIGRKHDRIVLEGDVPSPANPPAGCRFHTRCNKCMDICKTQMPELRPMKNDPEHFVACHLADTAETKA